MSKKKTFSSFLGAFILTLAKLPIWLFTFFLAGTICFLIGMTVYRAAVWLYEHFLKYPW